MRVSRLALPLLLLSLSTSCLLGQGASTDKGVTLPTRDGFVNVQVVNSHFQLHFLDAEKKAIEPPFDTGWIRYRSPIKGKKKNAQTLKNKPLSREGMYLTSPIPVQPPHKLFIFFGFGEGDDKMIYSNVKLYQ